MLKEEHDIEITYEHARLLCRMAASTDYVEELGISCGPHWTIKITKEGMNMIMKYGSYLSFLEAEKREHIAHTNEAVLTAKEKKVNMVRMIIIIIVSILTIISSFSSFYENKRVEKLEELLRKNNIEIPE